MNEVRASENDCIAVIFPEVCNGRLYSRTLFCISGSEQIMLDECNEVCISTRKYFAIRSKFFYKPLVVRMSDRGICCKQADSFVTRCFCGKLYCRNSAYNRYGWKSFSQIIECRH